MHLVIATRGYKPDVDRFITELQGKYFPYKCDAGTYAVGMNVQPIQLWSLNFPKESMQQVLNTIQPKPFSDAFKKVSFLMRKFLGLQEIPEINKKVLPMPIYRKNIEITAIGMKEDLAFTKGELIGGEYI